MTEELIKASSNLARTAPDNWQRFVQAFEAHTHTRFDQTVSSTTEAIFQVQGAAREARDLLKTFKECVSRADRIEEKRK